MNRQLQQYAERFDARTLRERGLVALSLVAVIVFLWWNYHAAPVLAEIDRYQQENGRLGGEIQNTRNVVAGIRQRIAAGVHQEKEARLARLVADLAAVEERLRLTTIELVDPEQMFQLMNELIYRDSKLKLISLKRREVRAAIPPADAGSGVEDAGIYRHVLEARFAGRYLDVLRYMQALEALDWKLLWDEIEIVSEDPPRIEVRVVMSTLSTQKQWVGI